MSFQSEKLVFFAMTAALMRWQSMSVGLCQGCMCFAVQGFSEPRASALAGVSAAGIRS